MKAPKITLNSELPFVEMVFGRSGNVILAFNPPKVTFNVTDDYVYIIGLEEEQLGYGTTNCVTQIKSNEPTTNNFTNLSDGCQNMTNWYDFITTNSADFSSDDFPAFNYCLTYITLRFF